MTEAEIELSGWRKHFNTMTIMGRRNIAIGTYASIFGMYVLYRLFRKKK